MASGKRRKSKASVQGGKSTVRTNIKDSTSSIKLQSVSSKPTTPAHAPQKQQTRAPIIPFKPDDHILLIGEGDFSFAVSLLTTHSCTNLCATTPDSPEALDEKHGDGTLANITTLEQARQLVIYHTDATKLSATKKVRSRAQRGGWDRVWFNFPHTGGASTDVNRQVRANQALLVGFFASATPLLSRPDGTILVTLFEGEPYSLWNIRNLARHCGLVVRRSWRFDREVYPGYRHARTIGRVRKGGKGGEVSETAWRGELRPARTFEFGLKEAVEPAEAGSSKKRKRDGRGSDSDSGDDD